jgi:acyl-CoA reductase-like NAD-dependent aldehyde dehydrogenase
MKPLVFQNHIDGRRVSARSGKTFQNRNPADPRELIGVFPLSGADDVDRAVQAARAAFPSWSRVPAPKRGLILYDIGRQLAQHKEEIARLMTREMGKVLEEARGDVQEAVDMALYAAGEGRRLFGETTPSELPSKFCMSVRRPVGVCAIITPWNFPVAVPSWKLFPALLCGNTVVFKPAEDAPATAARLVEIMEEAGVPAGVVNLVHGDGKTGRALVQHPHIDLVSFTGSCEVGREIAAACGKNLKKHSLELGGKNGQIVLEDADLELAVEGALWGAFGTTGQRCTATSRLILQKSVKPKFMSLFIPAVRKLRVGQGLAPGVHVGPLVNKRQLDRVMSYVRAGVREGAILIAGGKPLRSKNLRHGFFFEPTVFDQVKPSMRIAQEEIFGPVVSVIEAGSLDESIRVLNGTCYGLSSSIYTRDINKAFKAIRDLEAGITYINGPTIGAEVHLPFGGVKNTGNGHREAGQTVFDIFTEWKTVYIDYSQKLQKAQIDA